MKQKHKIFMQRQNWSCNKQYKQQIMRTKKTNKGFLKWFLLTTIFLLVISLSYAQPVLPQRTITVYATQGLHFGTLCLNGT